MFQDEGGREMEESSRATVPSPQSVSYHRTLQSQQHHQHQQHQHQHASSPEPSRRQHLSEGQTLPSLPFDTIGVRKGGLVTPASPASPASPQPRRDSKSTAGEDRGVSAERVKSVECMAEVLMQKHARLVDDYEDLALRNDKLVHLLHEMEGANHSLQQDLSSTEQALHASQELTAYLKQEVERSKTASSAATEALSEDAQLLREEVQFTQKAWEADRNALIESFSAQVQQRLDSMVNHSTQTDTIRVYDKATGTLSLQKMTVAAGTNTVQRIPHHEATQTITPLPDTPAPPANDPPEYIPIPHTVAHDDDHLAHLQHLVDIARQSASPQRRTASPRYTSSVQKVHPVSPPERRAQQGAAVRYLGKGRVHREGEASMEVSPATSVASSPHGSPGRWEKEREREKERSRHGWSELDSPGRVERFDPVRHLAARFESAIVYDDRNSSAPSVASHTNETTTATTEPTAIHPVWTTEALIGSYTDPQIKTSVSKRANSVQSNTQTEDTQPYPILAEEVPAEERVAPLVSGNTSPRRAPHLGPSSPTSDGAKVDPILATFSVGEEVVHAEAQPEELQEHPGARIAWPVGALCRTAAGSLGRIKSRAPNGFLVESDVANDVFLPHSEVRILRASEPAHRQASVHSVHSAQSSHSPRSSRAGSVMAPAPVSSLKSPSPSPRGGGGGEGDDSALVLRIPSQERVAHFVAEQTEHSSSGPDPSQYPRALHPGHYHETSKRNAPYTPKKYSLPKLAGC